jgi:hypothetical protein
MLSCRVMKKLIPVGAMSTSGASCRRRQSSSSRPTTSNLPRQAKASSQSLTPARPTSTNSTRSPQHLHHRAPAMVPPSKSSIKLQSNIKPPVPIPPTISQVRAVIADRRHLPERLRIPNRRATQCPRNRSWHVTRSPSQPADHLAQRARARADRALGQLHPRFDQDQAGR